MEVKRNVSTFVLRKIKFWMLAKLPVKSDVHNILIFFSQIFKSNLIKVVVVYSSLWKIFPRKIVWEEKHPFWSSDHVQFLNNVNFTILNAMLIHSTLTHKNVIKQNFCLSQVFNWLSFFFNVGSPCGVHLFDHLLWSIFQLQVHGDLLWAAFMYCLYTILEQLIWIQVRKRLLPLPGFEPTTYLVPV